MRNSMAALPGDLVWFPALTRQLTTGRPGAQWQPAIPKALTSGHGQAGLCTSTPALGRQRQVGLCESTLVSKVILARKGCMMRPCPKNK